MFSFAEENRGSLMEFFSETVRSRVDSILHPEGCKLYAWTEDKEEQHRLKSMCPAINDTPVLTGVHSQAFMMDRCVVKTNVFGEPYRDGQMSWLKWCTQHQSNPLVPRISLLLVDEETERFLTVMEKLVPHSGFENHSFRQDIDVALKAAFQRPGQHPAFRKELNRLRYDAVNALEELELNLDELDPVEDDELLAIIQCHAAEHRQSIRYIDELACFQSKLEREHRGHYKEIRNKFHAVRTVGQVIDVHGFNWMLRPNGEHVILDPIN